MRLTQKHPLITGGLPVMWAQYPDAGIPNPTWDENVQPIFDQYAKIYPGMKNILDLSDEQTVLDNIDALLEVFSSPFDDPHTMPVTRDLSPQKVDVINTWLNNERQS